MQNINKKMKKLFLLLGIATTLCAVSCNTKTESGETPEGTDSTTVVVEEPAPTDSVATDSTATDPIK